MNLRQLIQNSNLNKVYDNLIKLSTCPYDPIPKLLDIKLAYDKLIDILLSKQEKLNSWPILVKREIDWYYTYLLENPDKVTSEDKPLKPENYEYIHTCLLNPDYIAPDPKLKPWGGKVDKKDDAPEGFYNINFDNYNEYFGFGLTDWAEYLGAEIINPDNLDNETILANVLFEISWYGFTEDKQKAFFEELDKRTNQMYDFEGEDNRYE